MKQNGLIIGLILACLLGTAWVIVAATTGFLTGAWGVAFGLAVGLCFRFCCGASGLPASALSAALVAVGCRFRGRLVRAARRTTEKDR